MHPGSACRSIRRSGQRPDPYGDDMQRIFTAGSELEAHEARLFLESRGVRAFVDGESAAFPNFPFTRGSAPGVVVDDADAEQAQHLLADFPDNQRPPQLTGSWKCPKCGEKCGPNFDFCWNCEQPRPASDELPNDGEAPSFGIPIQPSVDAATDTTEAEMSVASSIAGTTSRRELWLEVLVALSVSWLPHFAFSILSRIWTIQRGDVRLQMQQC